jgi:hypothetical protein
LTRLKSTQQAAVFIHRKTIGHAGDVIGDGAV